METWNSAYLLPNKGLSPLQLQTPEHVCTIFFCLSHTQLPQFPHRQNTYFPWKLDKLKQSSSCLDHFSSFHNSHLKNLRSAYYYLKNIFICINLSNLTNKPERWAVFICIGRRWKEGHIYDWLRIDLRPPDCGSTEFCTHTQNRR